MPEPFLTVDEIIRRSDEGAARTILEVAKDNNAAIRTFLISNDGCAPRGPKWLNYLRLKLFRVTRLLTGYPKLSTPNVTAARTTYPSGQWTSDYEGVTKPDNSHEAIARRVAISRRTQEEQTA